MSWLITPELKVPTDPFRSNVSLLLHGDGANGSQTIIDSSPTPKTVTAAGNAQISTAQSKFGGGSILFDGNSDRLEVSGGDAYVMDGNFTIEFWVRFNATTHQGIVAHRTGFTARGWSIYTNGTGIPINQVGLVVGTGAAITFSNPCIAGTFSINTWHHLAFVRFGAQMTGFLDGTSGAPQTYSTIAPGSGSLLVGNGSGSQGGVFQDFLSTQHFNGYIDDLRITKGVARYTSNFTPPTAPFPDI